MQFNSVCFFSHFPFSCLLGVCHSSYETPSQLLKPEDCFRKTYLMFGVVNCISAVVLRTHTLAGTPPPPLYVNVCFPLSSPSPSMRTYYVDSPRHGNFKHENWIWQNVSEVRKYQIRHIYSLLNSFFQICLSLH